MALIQKVWFLSTLSLYGYGIYRRRGIQIARLTRSVPRGMQSWLQFPDAAPGFDLRGYRHNRMMPGLWGGSYVLPCDFVLTCRSNRFSVVGKTMPNKTYRNHARTLVQIMRMGWYRQFHFKSWQCQLWRSLLVARRTIVNEMLTIENVVRAILREAGIKFGTPACATFVDRLRELTGEGASVMALAFRAKTDWPDRFRRSCDVGAHMLLTPTSYLSGETDIQGPADGVMNLHAQRSTKLPIRFSCTAENSGKWLALRLWGHSDRQTQRHGTRTRRGCPRTCRHPASHMVRCNRIPFRQETQSGSRLKSNNIKRQSTAVVPETAAAKVYAATVDRR